MAQILVSKHRSTAVDTMPMVAGFYEVLERDKKGRPIRKTWHPQLMKDSKGKIICITVNVPVEEQFNNKQKEDFYLKKGYMPLGDAEENLKEIDLEAEFARFNSDDTEHKLDINTSSASMDNKNVQETEEAQDPGVMKPKRTGKPKKV